MDLNMMELGDKSRSGHACVKPKVVSFHPTHH